ncbi:MAG: response regulator transcription factor [Solirubrobacteraceae bacterium]|nr:response regulator transcription factor [Solirubrobacteraceae bacterium]
MTASNEATRTPALDGAGAAVKPTVVLVDDHALFRAGVRSELAGHVHVVGEAADVESAIAVTLGAAPDVLLLDVHLPGGGGVTVLEEVLLRRPTQMVLALTVSDAPQDVIAVVRAGARGYVEKSIDPADLVAAIHSVAAGEPVFSPRLAGFVLEAFSGRGPVAPVDPEIESLTPRERDVMRLIALGFSYKQAALKLEIGHRTVESHVSSVLRKLQLSSRHELARWASRRGLTD